MKKEFYSKRHKELYEKFERKKLESLMVLGGALEEDAKKFDLNYYKQTIKKSIKDYNELDSLHSELTLNYMDGDNIYGKLDSAKKPIYCRVLDNIVSELPTKCSLEAPKNDSVYRALVKLSGKIESIFEKQFEPYLNPDNEEDIAIYENSDKYWMELESKQSFVNELIDYLKNRGPIKKYFEWGENTHLTPKRYKFLLENLVKAKSEVRKIFEEELIKEIPMFKHERFYLY